ncbi:MAG: TfoX/Sxy family protein [Thermoleophilia bacterium]|nr:TfoX/Sxy family protein [Thermoleophilia bacterium]
MTRDPAADRAEDALAPLGPVHARAMFGGHGVFVDDAMVGLLADGVLYLKVDDRTRPRFEAAGLEAFVFAGGRTGPMRMSFHRAPEPLEDWESLRPWAEAALEAASRAREARRRRVRRPPA